MRPNRSKTLDGNKRRTQYRPVTKSVVMLSEAFSGPARGCEADHPVWADLAMHFFAYSILATAIVVVLIECGYALFHLFLLV